MEAPTTDSNNSFEPQKSSLGQSFLSDVSEVVPPKQELDAPSKKPIKKFIKAAKFLTLVLILVWIFLQLERCWSEIIEYQWQIRYGWLLISGLLYIIAFIPSALFWFLSLRWLGQSPQFWQSVKAFYFSQLGKYIPGKAMVVIIRSEMASGPKVRASIAAVCVFYETLTMMGSGAFIAALIVLCYFRQHLTFSCMALGVALVSLLPLIPPVFVRILKVLRIGKNDLQVQESLQNLKYSYLFKGFFLMIFLWLGFGLSLWAAIKGLGITTPSLLWTLPRYVAVVALAMTLGFAVPISPGGLGIREAVTFALLTPYFSNLLSDPSNSSWTITPEALATIVSLVQRVTSIIAEVGIVALLSLFSLPTKLGQKKEQKMTSEN